MAPKRVSERTLNRWLRLGLIRGYSTWNETNVTVIGWLGNRRQVTLEKVAS